VIKGGEHVIVSDNTYGGTFRLFDRSFELWHPVQLRDTSDVHNVEAAIKDNTRMVFVETPTNPVMIVTDLKAVSDVAHAGRARSLRQHFHVALPAKAFGIRVDIVVHSTTKFLNGHSDGVGGAVLLNNEDDANWIQFVQNGAGAILSPFDSWLVLRGTKTLGAAHGTTR